MTTRDVAKEINLMPESDLNFSTRLHLYLKVQDAIVRSSYVKKASKTRAVEKIIISRLFFISKEQMN